MYNLLSYCGLVDARISASEKDLPVLVKEARSQPQNFMLKCGFCKKSFIMNAPLVS